MSDLTEEQHVFETTNSQLLILKRTFTVPVLGFLSMIFLGTLFSLLLIGIVRR